MAFAAKAATGMVRARAQPEPSARDIFGSPDNYLSLLRQLGPGDTLALAPGVYRDTLPLHGMLGEPGRPITIRGPSGDEPARFLGRNGRNTVSLKDSAYLEVRDLTLDGQGLEVDGVKAEGPSKFVHHITLSGLAIVNHGFDQGTVGISSHCPAWGWVIRNNVIDGAGTGMYLGRPDDRGAFVGGLIEGNIIRNTLGYNIQIKHQRFRQSAPGMPENTLNTVIRGNVFSKGGNASIGDRARPNLLVGHFPPVGPGSEDMYLIHGNIFYGNPTEALFQGEGNVACYSNMLVNPHGPGISIQPHNGAPRVVRIFQNTVVARGTGISVRGVAEGFTPIVFANAVFADPAIRGNASGHNLGASYAEAERYLRAPLAMPPVLDVSPRTATSLAFVADVPPDIRQFPAWNKDALGAVRSEPVLGALTFRASGAALRIGMGTGTP